MPSIYYRIEPNNLTETTSYKLRLVSQGTAGYDEVAARVALKNPGLSAEMVKTALKGSMEEIGIILSEGKIVTLENACTFRPSLHARLESPEAPLPLIDKLLNVTIAVSQPFVKALRLVANLERVAAEEKAPVLLSAEDTSLVLNDVLNSAGVLHLTGSHLLFDPQKPDCGCVIAGTRSGSEVQSQFARISDSEVLLVPHIPVQDDPWNNEYTVSISTKYTEHGSVRTGTYSRKLRSPLIVDLAHAGESGVGILTGEAESPYAWITARAGSGAAQVRIQALLDLVTDHLSLNILAMQEHGPAGSAVNIPENGSYVLPGFSGSAVTSLTVQVDYLPELITLIHNSYHGRMVDILDVVV
jgi:hypothetical protein